MNKGEIRTRVLEQVDWSPDQSASFKAKVDRFINRAYQQLALDAPFLFFEDEATIITQADVSSVTSESSDRLAVESTDKSVLQRSFATVSPASFTNEWPTDGTWDGRSIEIEDSAGKVYRRKIREVWSDEDLATLTTYQRLSIDTPWKNATDTGLTYRIFTPEYYLPPDVIELRSCRIFSPTHYQIQVTNQYDMERYEYLDYRGNESGRPAYVTRGKHFQIDAPTLAPKTTVETLDADKVALDGWVGPDQAGKFDYCYTYAWGYQDPELKTHSNYQFPRWESAPSPISATAEVIDAGKRIQVTLPNVDHMLDFYREWSGSALETPSRSKRSGLRKRIYVRRYSAIAPPDPSVRQEYPEIFYLLAEIAGDVEDYKHDGSAIPDYYQRLKETHGYQSIRFWPMPDSRYEIDMRVLRRPNPLVNDQDAPRIHEEAAEVLIHKTLASIYEAQGSAELTVLAEQRYASLLETLNKRYAMIPRHRPRKKMARVTRPYLTTRVRFTEGT